ncbi:hypothetical protein GH714_017741 [Hevea brasiliensis]|uniref:Uncharacterized protein n=1 Tax=Hevea brasiliensis TaxID=3981 RepID=A0A6A6K5B4_HEVBR|nr:hypothetical protein GH714_017741 [Hevea brasiliensis]
MEGDMDPHNTDVDMSAADEDAVKELDEMKKRLKEMEEEAAAFARCKLRLRKRWALFKVLPKRTNVPGMKQYRPRRFNPYMGHRFRRPYVPPYFYSPYGYGKVPRFRRPMRYMPYY